MGEWCTAQHGKVIVTLLFTFHGSRYEQTGLTAACLSPERSQPKEEVSRAVLEYVKKWVPQCGEGILAGSSVHHDRAFLAREMPELVDWLHYR